MCCKKLSEGAAAKFAELDAFIDGLGIQRTDERRRGRLIQVLQPRPSRPRMPRMRRVRAVFLSFLLSFFALLDSRSLWRKRTSLRMTRDMIAHGRMCVHSFYYPFKQEKLCIFGKTW